MLQAGSGLVTLAALGSRPSFAQEGAKLTGVGETVKTTAKPGPYRIEDLGQFLAGDVRRRAEGGGGQDV